MSDVIRWFIGTSGANEDLEAEAVLAWSARKHCSMPIEITFMRQAKKGLWSGWASAATGRTPFTSYRWSVPAVCGYQGKALYTDVDFVVHRDLAELWNQPIPSVGLVRKATGKLTTSCILWDCAKANGHVPDLNRLKALRDAHSTVLDYFRSHLGLLTPFAGNWDCPDSLGDGVGATHYTRVESQLHLKHAIPRLKAEGRSHWYKGEVFPHRDTALQALFDSLLAEATAAGHGIEKYRVTPFESQRKDFRYKHHGKSAVVSA